VIIIIAVCLIFWQQEVAFISLFLAYIFYGIIRHFRRAQLISRLRLQRKQPVKKPTSSAQ
jgi:hypothetical protein